MSLCLFTNCTLAFCVAFGWIASSFLDVYSWVFSLLIVILFPISARIFRGWFTHFTPIHVYLWNSNPMFLRIAGHSLFFFSDNILVWADCIFRNMETVPKNEPDLRRFTVILLISFFISLFFYNVIQGSGVSEKLQLAKLKGLVSLWLDRFFFKVSKNNICCE